MYCKSSQKYWARIYIFCLVHWELNDSNLLNVFKLKYIALCLLHKRTSSFNNLRASIWRKWMRVLLWELCHALNADRRIEKQSAGESDEEESTGHRFSWCAGFGKSQWEEFSHRFEWQEKARETEAEFGNLQPRASWRTGEEMSCSFFVLTPSYSLVTPGVEKRRTPPLTCPALPCVWEQK